ncbi:MAG: hypothetical protein RL372_711 [Bacteroidota bacterium]|jgi:sialate O-acetylesterase
MRHFFICFFLFSSIVAAAQLSIDQPIMSQMILQRGLPLVLSGKTTPATQVLVFIGKFKKYQTIAKQNGFWEIIIPSQLASAVPFSLCVVSKKDSLQYNNLLWGDVWICMGQSNMEFALKNEMHYKDELPIQAQNNIRVYNPVYIGKNRYANPYPDFVKRTLTPSNFYTGSWQALDSVSGLSLSAIGYYFAKIIAQNTGVPIGIMNVSVGGSPIEAWMSKASLESDTAFSKKVNDSWLTNNYLPVWIRQRGIENIGRSDLNGNHAFKPAFLYDAAVVPLSKLKAAGILWYQGESNAQEMERVEEYAALQDKMVASFRKAWGQINLPFYFVQLSSIDTAKYKSHYWQQFRSVQLDAFNKGHHMGMVVSMDKGAKNDVHPTDKKTIAQRLASFALHENYGFTNAATITKPIHVEYKNGFISISFNNQVHVPDNVTPKGFSLDGISEIEYTIKGSEVHIKTDLKPKQIYFGFSPFTSANLVDKQGVPIPAFIWTVK